MGSKRRRKRARTPNLPEQAYRAVRVKEDGSISSANDQHGFNPDYSYVVKDLRRIGLLAGFFITLLIVLSFYLR